MDDPTPRSKKDRETECVLGGSCSQASSPHLYSIAYVVIYLQERYRYTCSHSTRIRKILLNLGFVLTPKRIQLDNLMHADLEGVSDLPKESFDLL
jgi:hypothetical protein